MKFSLILFIALVMTIGKLYPQVYNYPFESTCNKKIHGFDDLRCWFKTTDLSNDINLLIVDSCISSINTVPNNSGMEIYDISLKRNRPALYNEHIYCFLKGKKLFYIICDSLFIDCNKLYALSSLKGRLQLDKILLKTKRVKNVMSTTIWENNDCMTLDFSKSIRSTKKHKKGFVINLFIKDECNSKDDIIEKSWE